MRGLVILLLAACSICPDPEMEVVSGAVEVGAGESVQLRASYGAWDNGPGDCGGVWTVNGVENGDDNLGRIDNCGLYTASAAFPVELTSIEIMASEVPAGQCSDCCPFATITLHPRR